jgi:uncharacterized Zn finger protein (UPF0148 family)
MNENDDTNGTYDDLSVEKKLGDLMLRGWIMLTDVCPVESNIYLTLACNTPLMKSPTNGQRYCVGCEAWHFIAKERRNMKYGELVSLEGKQDLQLKPTDIQKLPKQMNYNKFSINQQVLQSLNVKLVYLSNQLNLETDLLKTKEILECIKLCMENIRTASKLD